MSNWNEEAAADFSERYDSEGEKMIQQYLTNPTGLVKWDVVPTVKLTTVWKSFVKYGFVRNEKALDDIKESILNGIARLQFVTEIFAHTERDPDDVLEWFGYEFTEEQKEQYGDFFSDDRGSWMISDYGLPKLADLYPIIVNSKGDELLYALDKALNVVHQRSDLAAMFVEGGSRILTDLSES